MRLGREKVFGPGRAVPLDRNAKARIAAYARAWSARHRQPGQHGGPITHAAQHVLAAPHRPHQGTLHRSVRQGRLALAGDQDLERLRVPRSAAPARRCSGF